MLRETWIIQASIFIAHRTNKDEDIHLDNKQNTQNVCHVYRMHIPFVLTMVILYMAMKVFQLKQETLQRNKMIFSLILGIGWELFISLLYIWLWSVRFTA